MTQQPNNSALDMVDKLIKSGGRFDCAGFEKWKSDALGTISMRRPEVVHIIDGRPCPEPKPRARRGRPPVRAPLPTRTTSRDPAAEPQSTTAPTVVTTTGGSGDSGTGTGGEVEGDSTDEPCTQPSPPTQSTQPQRVQQQLSVQPADAATQPETVIWYTGPATATTKTATASVPFDVSSSILWTDDNSISNLDNIRDWHRDNTFLADFLYMTTTGAPRTFGNKFREKPGILSNGIAAWRGLVAKYQNHTRVRKDILVKKFRAITMEEDEVPEVFFLRLDEKRNGLALLGKAIDDDDVLTIILGQLPPFYDRVKYQAESQEDFNLEEAMIVMRNMHANRVEEEGRASRAAKGRSSAMAASTAKLRTFCKKKGHEESHCFKKKN